MNEKYMGQVRSELDALRHLLEVFPDSETSKIVRMAETIAGAVMKDNVVFTCGNGGSAADAQHIAGELVGRFRHKVRGYHASALTTNSSIVTALANDFSYEEVFSRQIESMGREGDVLLALSTSGGSENVIRAVSTAKALGIHAFAFSGKGGGRLAEAADIAIVVPHDDFARIQEIHMTLGHILCGLVEEIVMPPRRGCAECESDGK
ncbi:MAG: SIS domain-containing protein [Candidatus Krumholzibacteria bacterium]|nr:SIS domain-containing protein [Candidatus Krumholzibacteria bacterium]